MNIAKFPVQTEPFPWGAAAGAKARASLAALREIQSWEQGDYVAKGGWATMPGSSAEPNRLVAIACAEALDKPAP